MRVEVECERVDGARVPRGFSMGPRPIAVIEVLDRWLSADHAYFKVRGDDGCTYILREQGGGGAVAEPDEASWTLTFFVAGDGRWPERVREPSVPPPWQ